MYRPKLYPFFVLGIVVVPSWMGCSSERFDVGTRTPETATTPPLATTVDASAEAGIILYCPAYTCPAPLTTCSKSMFACDVNLLNDPMNCGACGVECPVYPSYRSAYFDCIEGKCAMSCTETTADCNGLLDDDCEATLGTNEHCSACGDTCTDPDRPCLVDRITKRGQCGCPPGFTFCGGSEPCVDLETSDDNCGACGNACDTSGSGDDVPPHTHYGCGQGQCGHLKCDDNYADCDDDLGAGNDLTNGCETYLYSPASCGSCTKVCASGQTCRENPRTFLPDCLCAPGETLCGTECTDLGTDIWNCGSCGRACSAESMMHGLAFCNGGACDYTCQEGWRDCNGNLGDGCETNVGADPRNCGTCGNACDLISGQPCVAGRCAVEPCEEGEGTR